MSFPFEKQPGERSENSSDPCSDQTDWDRVHAMDDEDIVFDDDNPEILQNQWNGGVVRFKGQPATLEQIEDFKRRLLAYVNRPRRKNPK